MVCFFVFALYFPILDDACDVDCKVGSVQTPPCFYVYDYVRIDPDNTLRIVVSVPKYTLVNEYGVLCRGALLHDFP